MKACEFNNLCELKITEHSALFAQKIGTPYILAHDAFKLF